MSHPTPTQWSYRKTWKAAQNDKVCRLFCIGKQATDILLLQGRSPHLLVVNYTDQHLMIVVVARPLSQLNK